MELRGGVGRDRPLDLLLYAARVQRDCRTICSGRRDEATRSGALQMFLQLLLADQTPAAGDAMASWTGADGRRSGIPTGGRGPSLFANVVWARLPTHASRLLALARGREQSRRPARHLPLPHPAPPPP